VSIHVARPGLLSTVQDLGRHGEQHLGVCPGGAMDPVALALANALVGNPVHAAALEITILGPELVLVSGEGTQSWRHIRPAFAGALQTTVFEPLGSVRVEVDPWDDAKWAVGAATLVLRASFAAPFEQSLLDLQGVVA